MTALDRKLLRDLWGMRGQAIAILFVVLAGVATYVSMRSVFAALQRSLDQYYQEYRFADGFASVRRAPGQVRARLAAVPGIARLETRVTAPVTLEVRGFDEPVSGLLVSVPEGAQPDLNRLALRAGRLVQAGREAEVVLNETFAEAHGLGPGDQLTATVNGRRRVLTVVGVALNPEHLLQIQPGSLFPDPERYGVIWMGRSTLEAAYDMTGAFNDVAFTLAPGASLAEVLQRVDLILAPYGGQGAIGRRDQPSHFAITEEFRSLEGTSTMLPAIFLAVAAFLLNIVVSRLIALQREQIGVLKAFGYGNLSIGAHYAKLVLVIALSGAALGTALGLWLGGLLGEMYLTYYRLPTLDYAIDVPIVVTAILLTAGASLLGVLQAVRRAVRLSPAIAMRAAPPPTYRATALERLGLQRLFDQPTRMIMRNLERQWARALLTVVGIASSCAILVMGLFFSDSFDFILHAQYGVAQREDLAVTFIEPTSTAALYELASLPGVQHVEPFRAVPVRLRYQHRRYDTAVQGLPEDAYLHRIIDRELLPITVPAEGLVLTERLAQVLAVGVGDELTVEVREGSRRTRPITVTALTSQFVGMAAYMELTALNRLAGSGQAVSGAYLMGDLRAERALTRALQQRPRVASIISQDRAIAAVMESIERSMLAFTYILSLFAAVIAFGVIYNSARIALSERDRELASLRVLGFTRGEIAYILLGEMAVLTLLAIPLGMALGALAAAGLVASLQTDMYQFPLVLARGTFGLAASIVLGAGLVSALIVRRRLDRLDLVGVLKTRE
ncbi:MAG TPA: ABC transporter permease [Longimicrobiales bacterium]|nr:ABC transporter permease [Longimicrobiales bacterium]